MLRFIALAMLFLCVGLIPLRGQERSPATSNGAFLVSGTASISSQGGESGDRLNIFALSSGTFSFVSPGLGLGADITFSSMSRGSSSSSSYGIGPKIGYFHDTGESTIPFAGLGLSYLGGSSSYGSSKDGYRARLGAGLLLRRSHLGVIIEAAYVVDEFENSSTNSFVLSFGFAGLFY